MTVNMSHWYKKYTYESGIRYNKCQNAIIGLLENDPVLAVTSPESIPLRVLQNYKTTCNMWTEYKHGNNYLKTK